MVPHTRGSNDGNDDAVQPGQRAAGVGDVVSKEPEPKKRYVQRKNLGTRNAKGAKANDSSDGKIAPPPKKIQSSSQEKTPARIVLVAQLTAGRINQGFSEYVP